MPREPQDTPTTADGAVEHLPSCGSWCVAACDMSPRSAWRDPKHRRPPRVRQLHTGPIPEEKFYPRPLWDHLDDPAAVDWHRTHGCEVVVRGGKVAPRVLLGLPLPALDGPPEHPVYGLARFTADTGSEAVKLDQMVREAAQSRRAHVLETNEEKRVVRVAAIIRAAFPGITAEPVASPPVVKRTRRPSERQRALLALVLGEAPAGTGREQGAYDPMHPSCEHLRVVFTGIVWGLALTLFGRQRDPVSDYAFGRLLKGEPIKDQRPPFANVAHVLAVAEHELTGLGGGSCPWPQSDPRMAHRTFSREGEIKVSGGLQGTDRIRGEASVHRMLDARAAVRRAGLAPHEVAAAQVLTDRDLTRDEKALRLRVIEAQRRAPCPGGVTADFARELTGDVSDGELFRAAAAAEKRARAAVERVSREGDALAPKRPERPRARRAQPPSPEAEPYLERRDSEGLAGG